MQGVCQNFADEPPLDNSSTLVLMETRHAESLSMPMLYMICRSLNSLMV